jgi:hypothetical protein
MSAPRHTRWGVLWLSGVLLVLAALAVWALVWLVVLGVRGEL